VISTNGKEDLRFHNCGDARRFAEALLEVADPTFPAGGVVVDLAGRRPLCERVSAGEFVIRKPEPA